MAKASIFYPLVTRLRENVGVVVKPVILSRRRGLWPGESRIQGREGPLPAWPDTGACAAAGSRMINDMAVSCRAVWP
ncbi:hypothetical protein ACCAA_200003 [Candidatus Accumulibacter aalborgensis]|uniref:Uncharacterized protein n=1 Tax=Candidatus Accumulibacter aalborgensis TaxID=1860102 RepID=A0A1A8XJ86_9PROT|nr:hypothetical protein ACCAA_200003 [Candidatus Accumulibacter aalborgensis]